MNFWSVKNVQKYYNYKSVIINCQEILCHTALEVLRVHYLKCLDLSYGAVFISNDIFFFSFNPFPHDDTF